MFTGSNDEKTAKNFYSKFLQQTGITSTQLTLGKRRLNGQCAPARHFRSEPFNQNELTLTTFLPCWLSLLRRVSTTGTATAGVFYKSQTHLCDFP